MYDAIVEQIDWDQPSPWLTFLRKLNDSQRFLVSVWQVHEHAMFKSALQPVSRRGLDQVSGWLSRKLFCSFANAFDECSRHVESEPFNGVVDGVCNVVGQ